MIQKPENALFEKMLTAAVLTRLTVLTGVTGVTGVIRVTGVTKVTRVTGVTGVRGVQKTSTFKFSRCSQKSWFHYL